MSSPDRRELFILSSLAKTANISIKHLYTHGLYLLPTTVKSFTSELMRFMNFFSGLQTLSIDVSSLGLGFVWTEGLHLTFWKGIGRLLPGAGDLTSLVSFGPINISTLHHLRSLHLIITFQNLRSRKNRSPKQSSSYSNSPTAPMLSKKSPSNVTASLKSTHLKKSIAKLWRPLDSALSAMGSGEPVFGYRRGVEIVLSASTIPAAQIHRFVMGQGKLLPSVDARG